MDEGARDYVGTVKWFNDAKGYGFIGRDDGVDVFVHFTGIEAQRGKRRTLTEGDRVEFNVVEGQKGMQADGVRLKA